VKLLHRPDWFGWSVFDAERNVDFNGWYWQGAGGVLVDPLPMSAHDRAHLASLGGASLLVITNSDHVRGTAELAQALAIPVAGPAAERERFPLACARWLDDGDEVAPGMRALALRGSKTPGELALVVGDTLVTGDLVRGQRGGRLNLLPEAKLADPAAARASVARLAALDGIEAVLVGDGWPVFRGGHARLSELVA
jgi:hypothetical protein